MNTQFELGNKAKIGLSILGIAGLGYLTYLLAKKIKVYNEQLRIQKEAKEAELKLRQTEFNTLFIKWKKKHNESEVSKATLQNEKVALADRSYLYSKLNAKRLIVLATSFEEYESGISGKKVEDYMELLEACECENSDALAARIVAMKESDKSIAAKETANEIKMEQERKYQHELDILKEKHNAELNMYKAKAETEKVKMNSLAKALKSSDNKSLNTSFNIKTNISED